MLPVARDARSRASLSCLWGGGRGGQHHFVRPHSVFLRWMMNVLFSRGNPEITKMKLVKGEAPAQPPFARLACVMFGISGNSASSTLFLSSEKTHPEGNPLVFALPTAMFAFAGSALLAWQLTREAVPAGCALLWYGAVVLAVAATASPMGSTAPLVGWGGSGNSMMMRHARVVRHKRSMGTLQLRGGGSDAEYDSKDAIKYDRDCPTSRRCFASVWS
jgi:hypothetical protein